MPTPRPSRQELLDRARAMVPLLRERAIEAERSRGISRQTHEAFAAAGFYKLFQPARYGGYEMPLGMMVEVAGELGHGCGSSAWIFSNLAVQSWIIGMHQPAAQDDVWTANPDALCASSFPVKGGTARRVDGGLLLNGVWSFASGIDFADWENLQALVPTDHGGTRKRGLGFTTLPGVGGAKMVDIPTAQARIAEAGAEIDAAEALHLKDCDDAMQLAVRGEAPSVALRVRWRRNNGFAGQLCLRAVERLHPLAGARGLNQDSLFQLAVRDIHAAVSQITMAWDIQAVNAGRVQLGLPSLDPRL